MASATAYAPQSLSERKQQLVRDAIWDAATTLFEKKGYDETTIEDIAEKAGVSRRSFFRYFASKSDLMGAGVDHYAIQISEAIDACPPGAPLSEVFRRTIFQVAEHCASNPHTRRVMLIAAKYPAAREALQSRTVEVQPRVEAAFRHRCGKDRLLAGIVAGLAMSVLGVVFRVWFEQGKHDIAATVDQVLKTMACLVPALR
jgi:AcrR family transcriptional regulator